MRPDQKQRLEALSEKLVDVFLVEADPDQWAGGDTLPCDRTQQQRGNRHWDMKGAKMMANIVRSTMDILDGGHRDQRDDEAVMAARDDALERQIRDAEARAASAVERVMTRAKGPTAEFTRRAHGKT